MKHTVNTTNFLHEKPLLTKTELIILKFINNYTKSYFNTNIDEFARILNTSPSAITRFVQKYDFKTYKNFIIYFNNCLAKKESEIKSIKNDKIAEEIYEYTNKYKKYVDIILNEENRIEISKLINLMFKSHRILIFGMGSSSLCAQELSNNLSKIGFNIFKNDDMHMFISVLGNSNNNDLIIIVSNKMSSIEVEFILKLSKLNKVKVALITSTSEVSILLQADIKINYQRIYNTKKFVSVSSKIYQFLLSDYIFEKLISASHKLSKCYERSQYFLNLWLKYNRDKI